MWGRIGSYFLKHEEETHNENNLGSSLVNPEGKRGRERNLPQENKPKSIR